MLRSFHSRLGIVLGKFYRFRADQEGKVREMASPITRPLGLRPRRRRGDRVSFREGRWLLLLSRLLAFAPTGDVGFESVADLWLRLTQCLLRRRC